MNFLIILLRVFFFYFLIKLLFRIIVYFMLVSKTGRKQDPRATQDKQKHAPKKEHIVDAEYKEMQ